MATIEQILRMSATDRKATFGVSALAQHNNKPIGIETVIIDGIDFTDYGAFSFIWEKSYVKSPERSGDGSIGNLNSYSTFVTPHLKIDFSLMSIDSYRALMKLIYDKNEFTVTCYDVVNNRMTTNRMYFSTEEMPKLWTIARAVNGEEWVELLGVQDYTVEMIGTNASVDTVNILYYDPNGVLLYSEAATKGEYVVINYNYTAPSGSRFDGEWYKDGITNAKVRNGDAISANTYSTDINEIKLTAIVVPTNEYNLAISYGNGNELYNANNGEIINSIPVTKGESILTAFSTAGITVVGGSNLTFPQNGTGSKSVTYEGNSYTPYEFKGWYWTPVESDQRITNVTSYGTGNKTMYQIYEPKKYQVTYVVNNDSFGVIQFGTISVSYGQTVPLPRPMIEGYTFAGWYLDDVTFEKQFSGTMPPKDITIYAKWVRNQ